MVLGKIKTGSKKAFTLIELLVVITIIGILATGATAVYTSQIQKARDTTRINDIEALKAWVEQYYQDMSQYPNANTSFSWVITYIPKLPKDPKVGQTCNWNGTTTPTCTYIYWVSRDNNGIEFWEYELSTAFENSWNRTSKSVWDYWNDNLRYEVWLDVWDTGNHNTDCNAGVKINVAPYDDIKAWTTHCTTTTATAVAAWVWSMFINWN